MHIHHTLPLISRNTHLNTWLAQGPERSKNGKPICTILNTLCVTTFSGERWHAYHWHIFIAKPISLIVLYLSFSLLFVMDINILCLLLLLQTCVLLLFSFYLE